jgi:hypothetical protein
MSKSAIPNPSLCASPFSTRAAAAKSRVTGGKSAAI